MKPLLISALLVLLASCTCSPDPTGAFACTRDDQCINGSSCIDATCQPTGTNRCPVVDCQIKACDGLVCDAVPNYCQHGVCACIEAGGAPEPHEVSCGDGHDNDCDGQFDCRDPDCASQCDGGTVIIPPDAGVTAVDSGTPVVDAGAPTFDAGVPEVDAGSPVVDAGTPVADAGTPVQHETNCSDGLDNDGDHLTDCDDPDCEGKSCPGLGARVCCSGVCSNTAGDASNCGGCGLQCASGQMCLSVVASGHSTGTCGCSNMNCPQGQTCSAFSCSCSASTMCGASGVCDSTSGLNGYCRVNP